MPSKPLIRKTIARGAGPRLHRPSIVGAIPAAVRLAARDRAQAEAGELLEADATVDAELTTALEKWGAETSR